MIKLYWRGERGTKEDLYASFTTLEDFNRWSKKFLDMSFSKIIHTNDSEPYKIMMINFSLKFPSHLKIDIEKEND